MQQYKNTEPKIIINNPTPTTTPIIIGSCVSVEGLSNDREEGGGLLECEGLCFEGSFAERAGGGGGTA